MVGSAVDSCHSVSPSLPSQDWGACPSTPPCQPLEADGPDSGNVAVILVTISIGHQIARSRALESRSHGMGVPSTLATDYLKTAHLRESACFCGYAAPATARCN